MRSLTYPTGEVITNTYNARGLFSTLVGATAYVSQTAYNVLGQVTMQAFGNGVTTNYAYNAANYRLQRIQTGSILDLRYQYDAVGNVTVLTDTTNSNQVATFGYDALDRLTSAATNAAGSGQYNETFTYDALGDILNRSGSAYSYGDSAHPHAVTAAGAYTYTYDPNGNMLTRRAWSGFWQQAWNADNRASVMTNTTSGAWVQFVYDGDGVRVKKIDNGITTTVYVGALFELNVTSGVTSSYYFANGKRVAVRNGLGLAYLHGDSLGSNSASTSVTGTLIARIGYGPYGVTRWSTAELPAQFGYTGQRYDQGDGWIYDYGARFYEPYLNRWLSPDSIVPQAGNPQDLNRYAYARNNPVKYVDPSGHWLETLWDLANIALDIHSFWEDPSFINGAALTVDVVAAILPVVPAGAGIVARGGKAVEKVALHADDLSHLRGIVGKAVAKAGVESTISDGALETIKKYGIKSFGEFDRPLTSGDAVHHLVEKRFWQQLGFSSQDEATKKILGIEVGQWIHGPVGKGGPTLTDQIRERISYRLGKSATPQQIWEAHRDVYREFGYDDLADLIWETYFKDAGILK